MRGGMIRDSRAINLGAIGEDVLHQPESLCRSWSDANSSRAADRLPTMCPRRCLGFQRVFHLHPSLYNINLRIFVQPAPGRVSESHGRGQWPVKARISGSWHGHMLHPHTQKRRFHDHGLVVGR
jgi:hypothetical protein